MSETGLTASVVISLTEELEEGSAAFYERLAKQFPEHESMMLTFAAESRKNKILVTRTYQETISDALEAAFAFEGLDLGDKIAVPSLSGDPGHDPTIRAAISFEEKAAQFYRHIAGLSQALLATIPAAFRRVAKKREKRIAELESLLR